MRGKEERTPLYPLADNQPQTKNDRPRIHQLTARQLKNFWRRVEKNEHDCWEWLGGRNNHGRGLVKLFGVQLLAPRVMWCLEQGVDPGEWDVLHTCDHPWCIRPDHMFLGTPKINADDRAAKGRFIASRGNTRLNLEDPDTIAVILDEDLTRAEKARRLGVAEGYVSRLCNRLGFDGRRKLSPEAEEHVITSNKSNVELADIYGVSVDTISMKRRNAGCPDGRRAFTVEKEIEIAHRPEPAGQLAKEFGVHIQTIYKWRWKHRAA